MKKTIFFYQIQIKSQTYKVINKIINIAVLIDFYHILPIDQIKDLRFFIIYI